MLLVSFRRGFSVCIIIYWCFLSLCWFFLVFSSSPAWSNPSLPRRHQSSLHGWSGWWCWRRSRHGSWILQQSASVWTHLSAAESRAVPQQPLRSPVRPAALRRQQLHHGHRQYMRAGGPAALQYHRVGAEYPLLSWPARVGAGGPSEAQLEWTVHPECSSVGSAAAYGPPAGSCRFSFLPHARWPRRVLHGPGAGLPGPGGQADTTAGGFGWIQLFESHCSVLTRWVMKLC